MERVIAVYPGLRGKNPFLDQLTVGLESSGSRVVGWREAPDPGGRPAALLLHWFENRAVDPPPRSNPWRTRRLQSEREAEFYRRLTRIKELRNSGYRLLWFAHNRRPHNLREDQKTYDERIAPFWDLIDGVVHLTEASRRDAAFRFLSHLPSAVVPHPHYPRVERADHQARAGAITRVAFVGGFSPRKHAVGVIREVLRDTGLTTVVTGGPPARRLQRELRRIRPGGLQLVVPPISDEQLYRVFDGHTAAVLTDLGQLNSGVLFLALSRGAPVVVPSSPTNDELSGELGARWIRCLDGPVTSDLIVKATTSPVPFELPEMTLRSPRQVASELVAFIDQVTGIR